MIEREDDAHDHTHDGVPESEFRDDDYRLLTRQAAQGTGYPARKLSYGCARRRHSIAAHVRLAQQERTQATEDSPCTRVTRKAEPSTKRRRV